MCKQIKYAIPEDMIAAIEFTQGTGLLPRDVLMAAAFGTLVTGYLTDGRVLYGARVMADEIQPLLDSITDIPGSMLFRGPTGWIGIPPGAATEVLVCNGAIIPPGWTDPAIGTLKGAALTEPAQTAQGTYPARCKGTYLTPLWDMAFRSLAWAGAQDATATYAIAVYELSGDTISAIVADFTGLTWPTSSDQWAGIVLPAPVPLTQGQPYCIALRATNKAPTYAIALDYGADALLGAPLTGTATLGEIDSAAPAIGDTFTTFASLHQAFRLGFTW